MSRFRRFPRRHRLWSQKSNRRRRNDVVLLRNRIRANAKWFGGSFYSDSVIDGASWCDIYFISSDGRRIYNATISTALYEYDSALRSIAVQQAESVLESPPWRFERSPGSKFLTLLGEDQQSPEYLAAFGPEGRHAFISRCQREMAEQGLHPVFESVSLHFDYAYGVGLEATIDVPSLSVRVVAKFVADFLASGELPYESDIPLTFKPSQLDQVIPSNPVGVSPEQWATSLEGEILSASESAILDDSIPIPQSSSTPSARL